MAKKVAAAGPVEGRWTLPAGWDWYRAKDIAKIVGGSTPKNASNPTNYSEDGTAWLTPADLSGYSRPTIGTGRRNLASHVVNRSALLSAGAVLISSRAPVGYCAVASNPMVTNQGFRSLVLADHLDPFFVRYYVLLSRKYLEDHASGTTFKELSGGALGDLVFPVPPLDLQRQIVARIDELFAEIDDGEAALARARDDLATWRKALLKAAVTGELTADWRSANSVAETGTALLAHILRDRRAQWVSEPRNARKKYVEPMGIDLERSESVPAGWAVATIEQVAFVENGQTPKGIDDVVEAQGDIPWFKVSSMNALGNTSRLTGSAWWLSAASAAKLGLRVHPAGTIVFPKRGGSIFTEKKRRLGRPGSVDLNVMAVVPLDATADHLWTFFRNLSLRAISDGSNVPQINYDDVAQLRILLPPSGEAKEISARVESALAITSDVEADIDQFVGDAATLRQSILAAAFRGELA